MWWITRRLKKEIAQLKEERANLEMEKIHLNRGVQDAREHMDRLLAFKAYVHTMLDSIGIDPFPDGKHSAAGCRIGDRLEIVKRLIETKTDDLRLRGSFIDFQKDVQKWMVECFGEEILDDTNERGFRFMEEALELVQSLEVSKEDVLRLVDYVYSRPIGEVRQEAGAVMITLAALCACQNISLNNVALDELDRVEENKEKIRLKHQSKETRSPLPGQVSGNVTLLTKPE